MHIQKTDNFTMKKKLILAIIVSLNSLYGMSQINWQANPIGSVFAREGGESPEGTYHAITGGYEVYTIVASDKSFQPASLYYGVNDVDKEKIDAMSPDGKVPTSMNCFLVRIPGGYIMFDTGLPASKGGKTLERLASLGVDPSDVKMIYLTHGHFDHIGGLLNEDGSDVFSKATIYISAPEYNFVKSSMKDSWGQIENAYGERLVIFEFGEVLTNEVLPISAKGHTPGHTAYRLGNLLFIGDIMHGPALQLLDPEICASYDADKSLSIETRKKILSYAVSNSLTVLGAHIPLNGILF